MVGADGIVSQMDGSDGCVCRDGVYVARRWVGERGQRRAPLSGGCGDGGGDGTVAAVLLLLLFAAAAASEVVVAVTAVAAATEVELAVVVMRC